MPSMSVSLPEQMRSFIKSQIESGQYHNESEYIRDLIRHDQAKLAAEMALLRRLEASEASGVSDLKLPDIMKRVKERMRADGRL